MKFTIVTLIAVMMAAAAVAQMGPGSGPWEVRLPESQGLRTAELEEAEARTNAAVDGRVCYIVIKNGYIVYEKYYGQWNANRTRAGWSTTKSMCSALYGVAAQQGWANHSELVRDRVSNTRRCNNAATFRHVLTMTGESNNINNPQFSYDTDGTRCLDTLSDFVAQNNPAGQSAKNWKDANWESVLGMENFEWENYLGYLHCGYTSYPSCRDLARTAQLWVNEGVWDGDQVAAAAHFREGRTWVYPTSGTEYGFTGWLDTSDPVDDEVYGQIGMYSQCTHSSHKHQAIVVSMGDGDISGARCSLSWTHSRDAIVSDDMKHTIRPTTAAERADEERALLARAGVVREEILAVRDYVEAHPDRLTAHELATFSDYLIEWGEPPLRLSHPLV